ncbi:TPA: hypothetical protein JD348_14655 [Serratia marcescens]|nr:hypothetical protein [Serratia marcescens]
MTWFLITLYGDGEASGTNVFGMLSTATRMRFTGQPHRRSQPLFQFVDSHHDRLVVGIAAQLVADLFEHQRGICSDGFQLGDPFFHFFFLLPCVATIQKNEAEFLFFVMRKISPH